MGIIPSDTSRNFFKCVTVRSEWDHPSVYKPTVGLSSFSVVKRVDWSDSTSSRSSWKRLRGCNVKSVKRHFRMKQTNNEKEMTLFRRKKYVLRLDASKKEKTVECRTGITSATLYCISDFYFKKLMCQKGIRVEWQRSNDSHANLTSSLRTIHLCKTIKAVRSIIYKGHIFLYTIYYLIRRI